MEKKKAGERKVETQSSHRGHLQVCVCVCESTDLPVGAKEACCTFTVTIFFASSAPYAGPSMVTTLCRHKNTLHQSLSRSSVHCHHTRLTDFEFLVHIPLALK